MPLFRYLKNLTHKRSTNQTPNSILPPNPQVVANRTPKSESAATPQPPFTYELDHVIKGRYQVKKVLEGGMAHVYLCLDLDEMKPVGLKSFKPESLGHPDVREQFLKECNLWINLDEHPNIVNAYAVTMTRDRTPFLVLEWVGQTEGKKDSSLRSFLTPGYPIAIKQAVIWGWEIAQGMLYATRCSPGLIHRDLKPENILIGFDRRARITDFGLAVAAHSGMKLQRPDLGWAPMHTQVTEWGVCGTPLYMAPEQWTAGHTLDQRTDIYALGAIMYELVTGRPVAWGDNLQAIYDAHLIANCAPFSGSIPASVRSFIQTALSPVPEQRFVDWGQVAEVLGTVIKEVTGQLPSTDAYPESASRAASSLSGSWCSMADAYLDLGKTEDALICANKAIVCAQEVGTPKLQAIAINSKGRVLQHLGHPGALPLFIEATDLLSEESNPTILGGILMNLAAAYRLQGDMLNARDCCLRAVSIAERVDDPELEASALNTLGNISRASSSFEEALSLYGRSLALYEQVGHLGSVCTVLNNIGITYRQLKRPIEALKFYERCLEGSKDCGDLINANRVQGNIGNLYRDIGEYDKALAMHQAAFAGAKDLGIQRGAGLSLANIGYDYLAKNDLRKAELYLNEALTMARAACNSTDETFAEEGLRILGIVKARQF